MTLGTETEYIPRDDETEAIVSGSSDGTVYLDPEDVSSYNLSDFGLNANSDRP